MNFTTGSSVDELLSLDKIRSTLIRLEDTIIFGKHHLCKTGYKSLMNSDCSLD
jgi:hypothetical protein